MTYVLGITVLVVWGLILYRVFAAWNNDDDPPPVAASASIKAPYNDYEVKSDTGKLRLNYRDPFAPVNKDTLAPLATRPRLPVVKPVAALPFNWGFIKYSGYVRNPGSKKLIALLTINGKNAMLAEGESADAVELVRNLRDSVMIRYKDRTKFITLNAAAL